MMGGRIRFDPEHGVWIALIIDEHPEIHRVDVLDIGREATKAEIEAWVVETIRLKITTGDDCAHALDMDDRAEQEN